MNRTRKMKCVKKKRVRMWSDMAKDIIGLFEAGRSV